MLTYKSAFLSLSAILVAATLTFSGCGSGSDGTSSSSYDSMSSLSSMSSSSLPSLEPVDNSGGNLNALGYFGPGIQLGNKESIGYWYMPFDARVDMQLNEDGTGTGFFQDDDFGWTPPPYTYGISQDGLVMSTEGGSIEIRSKINQHCYDVNGSYIRGDFGGLLCKPEVNDLGMYGSAVYFQGVEMAGLWYFEKPIHLNETLGGDRISFSANSDYATWVSDFSGIELFSKYGLGRDYGGLHGETRYLYLDSTDDYLELTGVDDRECIEFTYNGETNKMCQSTF